MTGSGTVYWWTARMTGSGTVYWWFFNRWLVWCTGCSRRTVRIWLWFIVRYTWRPTSISTETVSVYTGVKIHHGDIHCGIARVHWWRWWWIA
jgi:hypothetical protein